MNHKFCRPLFSKFSIDTLDFKRLHALQYTRHICHFNIIKLHIFNNMKLQTTSRKVVFIYTVTFIYDMKLNPSYN